MGVRGSQFRVVGYVSSAFGLGIAAANAVNVLQSAGLPVSVVDVDPGDDRGGRDASFADLRATSKGGRGVNLFHMNPLEIIRFQQQWRLHVSLARGLNACVPFWELPHLPAEWVEVLDAMDVVLAPTRFVKTACDEVLARPSVHYPQAVFVPADVMPDRQRWGFGDEQCVFLLAFDLQSDLQRKNPHAAIEAFALAFGDDAGALLAIKLNTARLQASQAESLAALKAVVSERANVVLIEEHLAYRDVLTLYASCDVMVSTHRSEGLGLHLMEAMSLGRAVMATGWSGNMDFMTEENSVLIPYKLVPVSSDHAEYSPQAGRGDQLWADVDVDVVGDVMARLRADRALRERLGERASADMAALRERVSRAEPLEALCARVGERRDAGQRGRLDRLRAQLKRARAADPNDPGEIETAVADTKRWIVTTLRRAGLYPRGE